MNNNAYTTWLHLQNKIDVDIVINYHIDSTLYKLGFKNSSITIGNKLKGLKPVDEILATLKQTNPELFI